MNKSLIRYLIRQKTNLLILGFLVFGGCNYSDSENKSISYNSHIPYDIEIEYNSIPIDDERSLAGGDSVAIGFVGMFEKDTVDVFKNNKFYKTTILTSDTKTDGAGHLILDNYKLLDNVGIRINGGPLIFIETGRRDYHINLAYYNDQVIVKFYKYLPATY
jgi:hypothetical protein